MSIRHSNPVRRALLAAVALAAFGGVASAATVSTTVQASADLFNAVVPGTYEGSNPVAINVTGIASFTISNAVTTLFTLNGGTYNDADGIGSASNEYSSGASGLSGNTAPNAGFLAAVFLGSSVSATAPTALNFTSTGTSFASLAPALQQTFFVGDGLTGDATGTTQTFYVPAGATTLYFGVTDACGYSGGPGCYNDNSGSVTFNLTTVAAAVPEPMSVALMLAGLGGMGAVVRRRKA